MTQPRPRWGVRFTSDPTHNEQYVQGLYDNDNTAAKRGELFLNEPEEEIYYVDSTGTVKTAYKNTLVGFNRIDFTGLREFADDTAAAAADPAVLVGGLYHTSGVLKIRLA